MFYIISYVTANDDRRFSAYSNFRIVLNYLLKLKLSAFYFWNIFDKIWPPSLRRWPYFVLWHFKSPPRPNFRLVGTILNPSITTSTIVTFMFHVFLLFTFNIKLFCKLFTMFSILGSLEWQYLLFDVFVSTYRENSTCLFLHRLGDLFESKTKANSSSAESGFTIEKWFLNLNHCRL